VIAPVASGHEGEQGEVMPVLMDDQDVVTISKLVCVVVMVIAPLGGCAGVLPGVITGVNSLRAAGAGGFSLARGCALKN
jgi:hypothetical protein